LEENPDFMTNRILTGSNPVSNHIRTGLDKRFQKQN